MRLVVLQFLAGFFGALSSVFLLGSLGSDYWLMASESCGDAALFKLWRVTKDISQAQPDSSNHAENSLLFYHEGLFWRCSYHRGSSGQQGSILAFLITNQPCQKVCVPAYLSHSPVSGLPNSVLTSDSATGILVMSVVMLFAVWVQVSDSLEQYGLQRRRLVCNNLQLSVHYGPSFMLAPTAAFLCLLTGLLLLLIPSVSKASARDTENQPFSL
ncbi:transmembrane protein 182 isoform X2 [Carassius carassius]|uniref:transmembrane protein 182 isoform X2 n=1 Tax=Carassius carassius TaxID=217509 RepID=UPI002868ADA8|nr:transmembrane protein 182 isoform X2 [Carassius carassius]